MSPSHFQVLAARDDLDDNACFTLLQYCTLHITSYTSMYIMVNKGHMFVDFSGGMNPQNLGSAESKSFAILSGIRANWIRI
jgi:hypothetical protein